MSNIVHHLLIRVVIYRVAIFDYKYTNNFTKRQSPQLGMQGGAKLPNFCDCRAKKNTPSLQCEKSPNKRDREALHSMNLSFFLCMDYHWFVINFLDFQRSHLLPLENKNSHYREFNLHNSYLCNKIIYFKNLSHSQYPTHSFPK